MGLGHDSGPWRRPFGEDLGIGDLVDRLRRIPALRASLAVGAPSPRMALSSAVRKSRAGLRRRALDQGAPLQFQQSRMESAAGPTPKRGRDPYGGPGSGSWRSTGVEASPLVWFIGWLRTRSCRANCRFRLGSLWKTDLSGFQVVYVFLSPPPMPAIWGKATREMAPGAILLSHTFEVPGITPEKRISLPGRPDACLFRYHIGQSQEFPALAEIQ
jgi:hypothetical protein